MEGPCGIHCTGPYPASGADQAGGLTEFLFALGGGGDPMSPQLATAGQVDPDRASVTITLWHGVTWNSARGFEDIDFGEMTSRVITDVDFKRVPGSRTASASSQHSRGNLVGQSVLYPDNLREEAHAVTGTDLNPRDAPSYGRERAWSGDPWRELAPERARYTDTDNPPGMTDVAQARLVRLALGTAIDRASINERLPGGLVALSYSGTRAGLPRLEPTPRLGRLDARRGAHRAGRHDAARAIRVSRRRPGSGRAPA